MPLLSLAAAFLLAVAPAGDPRPAGRDPRGWEGRWKTTDPEVYATLEITRVAAAGFAVVWDENVGIQGVHEEGRATWTRPQAARFAGDRCTLTLSRIEGDRLRAAIEADSCFNWSNHDTLTFVREGVAVHERTSFDCAKATTAVERAVCADRDLAAADRLLAETYRETRKRAGDGVVAGQRRFVSDRDRECGALKEPRNCILLAYGRRLLALRAWPRAPFGADGRPDVDVLDAALRDAPALPRSGIREFTAGTVGGTPDEMSLELHRDATGIWLSGCDEPDRSRGFDPHGIGCGRQHYVAFLRNGETWAAWADADGVTIVPNPRASQPLPDSLLDFQENHGPPDDERDR